MLKAFFKCSISRLIKAFHWCSLPILEHKMESWNLPKRRKYIKEILFGDVFLSFLHCGEVCIQAKWSIRPKLVPTWIIFIPPGWDANHHQVTPSIKLAWRWREELCAQEHNTMSMGMARTQTGQSRIKYTSHEATTPKQYFRILKESSLNRVGREHQTSRWCLIQWHADCYDFQKPTSLSSFIVVLDHVK